MVLAALLSVTQGINGCLKSPIERSLVEIQFNDVCFLVWVQFLWGLFLQAPAQWIDL